MTPLRTIGRSVILSDARPILAQGSVLAERNMIRVQIRGSEARPPRTRRKAGFVWPSHKSDILTDALRKPGPDSSLSPWPSSHWTRGLDLPFPRRCVPECIGTILGVGYDAAQSKSPHCRACNGAVRSPRTSSFTVAQHNPTVPADWSRPDDTRKQAARVLSFGLTFALPDTSDRYGRSRPSSHP